MQDSAGGDERLFMNRAIELAAASRSRGDDPFGSVLVYDGEIVSEAKNAVVTESDPRRHPELDLAMEAITGYDPDVRSGMAMYTSTEPCPMCAGALRYAGLDRVVYSVSMDTLLVEIRGLDPIPVSAAEILAGVSTVEGPFLSEPGEALLRSHYGDQGE